MSAFSRWQCEQQLTGGCGQQLGAAANVGAHHAQPAQRSLQDADGQPLADGGLWGAQHNRTVRAQGGLLEHTVTAAAGAVAAAYQLVAADQHSY